MLMEKLNQLINCNDLPSINNQTIKRKRPQFQLLYEELESMIKTLFIEHEKVNDLKKRFTYAAEEAQYIVDLFLSSAHIRNNGHSPISDDVNPSLNLDGVWRSFNLVKVELRRMKLDSSRRPQSTLNQSSAATQISISKGSKKLLDENAVGAS
ncbi:hypothetical protein L1987_38203 [Smallanthus sonchifolius]|uniref:Uncharacterized protein n=3 Tax=Smallanthus sonchifolius TaxID=185202 RepID=A0ACB9HJ90_9ASTR|nr:hypothetical protein L1987_38201 [Smallanthus sonchifolius]KAI3795547.1 hypothetical protein L1987_38202 [Smallanthus sonchifolius]KAI3795548.1 hypothetical protein L1987_38203 [Smallanthus sonchifolius]